MNEKLETKTRLLEESIINAHRNDSQLFERLIEAQHELGILDAGRPFAPFLRPFFFTRAKYNQIAKAAEVLSGAFERVTEAALENREVMDLLDLTDEEESMARIDPGYSGTSHTSRLDTFLSDGGFKFLEYNGETPAGLIDQMQIEKVLALIPEVNEFLEKTPHWKPVPHARLLDALIEAYREFGGESENPNIAIVDWKEVATVTEFEVLRDYFESRGCKTIIADPGELEYDGKRLHAGDFVIDIFYKRVLIHEFLERHGVDNPLADAYRDHNIFMANSFRAKIPHKKASLAVLGDPRFARYFTDEQRQMAELHIPWTRRLADTGADYRGRTLPLTELLRKNKDRFLIKPNDDYGGSGIVFGWEVDQRKWEDAIERALGESYVAQERVEIEKVPFLTYSDEIYHEMLLVDFDPFLFRGRVEGGLVRMSPNTLVNVAQGGCETALVVLE